VGNHTADSLVEDTGRSAEVEGTGLLGVNQVTLVEVVVVAELFESISHTVSTSIPERLEYLLLIARFLES
jgi:biotin synthase-related radical SAM superfamily protein